MRSASSRMRGAAGEEHSRLSWSVVSWKSIFGAAGATSSARVGAMCSLAAILQLGCT